MNVALFITCLADTLRPEIGFASMQLLAAAGCEVSVPKQACCGQVNYNSGDILAAKAQALQWLEQFEGFDYVVLPSGSCAAMMTRHYAGLFSENEKAMQLKLATLSKNTYELSDFLSKIAQPEFTKAIHQNITYHDSCAGNRELGIKHQPRALLAQIEGITFSELGNAEACCGFGGSFCVKHPEIAGKLADDKIASIRQSGANLLVGGDWGCLMHLKARMDAQDDENTAKVEVLHFSELLARAL